MRYSGCFLGPPQGVKSRTNFFFAEGAVQLVPLSYTLSATEIDAAFGRLTVHKSCRSTTCVSQTIPPKSGVQPLNSPTLKIISGKSLSNSFLEI
jgi:hypothetical protein